jgi:iron complex transport system permease protein
VNAFLFAMVLLVLAVARLEAAEILLWLMGSLSLTGRLTEAAVMAAVVLVAAAVAWVFARELNALTLGDRRAAELGVRPERLKLVLFIVVSLVVGVGVSVAGIIGFVGLIVPHMARLVVGPNHRLLIPASMMLGAGTLVVADTVARTALSPTEIPVGVVTALAGAPFFMWLLRRSRRPW